MKVAFISELFPPFATGGAEWSTYFLANDLIKKNIDVVIITPNLGVFEKQKKENFKVIRFPFYLKRSTKNLPGNFSFTNPLWILWSTFWYFILLLRENPDIIHIQGKYSIPPVVIANFFLRKPMVATIRDYMAICNYGVCLMKGEKACGILDYFRDDFKFYYENYVLEKNILNLLKNLIYATYGRLTTYYLKFFVKRIQSLVCLSDIQRKLLVNNGLNKKIIVIRNSFQFTNIQATKKRSKTILYVGRLTVGKGIRLLIDAIEKINKKNNSYKFVLIGMGHLYPEIKKISKKQNIEILGQLNHEKVLKFYRRSILTVIPSIWPDPMPRTGIESISNYTPIVMTQSSGLSEIITDGKYGYLAEKDPANLASKILKAISNNDNLRNNIKNDYIKIKKKFTSEVIDNHLHLYNKLYKKN